MLFPCTHSKPTWVHDGPPEAPVVTPPDEPVVPLPDEPVLAAPVLPAPPLGGGGGPLRKPRGRPLRGRPPPPLDAEEVLVPPVVSPPVRSARASAASRCCASAASWFCASPSPMSARSDDASREPPVVL